jgi:hypothetical protein
MAALPAASAVSGVTAGVAEVAAAAAAVIADPSVTSATTMAVANAQARKRGRYHGKRPRRCECRPTSCVIGQRCSLRNRRTTTGSQSAKFLRRYQMLWGRNPEGPGTYCGEAKSRTERPQDNGDTNGGKRTACNSSPFNCCCRTLNGSFGNPRRYFCHASYLS